MYGGKYKIADIVHPGERRLAEQFVCSICTCIFDDPVQTKCDHIFCRACVTPCLLCPLDRAPLDRADLKPLVDCNKPLLRMMHNIKVRCPHRDPDEATAAATGESPAKRARTDLPCCTWEGAYTDLLAKHLLECVCHPVPCPLGCGETMKRRDVDEHKAVCVKSFEECPICCELVRPGTIEAHRKDSAELHVQLLEQQLCAAKERFEEQSQAAQSIKDFEKRLQALDEKVAKTQYLKTRLDNLEKGLSAPTEMAWRITGITSKLRRPKGYSISSAAFKLGLVSGVTLKFTPNYEDGKCRVSVQCVQDDVMMRVSLGVYGKDVNVEPFFSGDPFTRSDSWRSGWGFDFKQSKVDSRQEENCITVVLKLLASYTTHLSA